MEPPRNTITPTLTPISLQNPVLKVGPDQQPPCERETAARKAKHTQSENSETVHIGKHSNRGSKRTAIACERDRYTSTKQRDSYSDSKQKPQRRRHATASQKADELSFSLIQGKVAEYEKESKTIKHQLTSEKDKIQSMRTRTSMQKNR